MTLFIAVRGNLEAGKCKVFGLQEEDLEDIWLYTLDTWSRDQADRYYYSILDAVEQLAAGNLVGRDEPVREGYFKHPVGRHFIYYLKGHEEIIIMRVLHQMMDAKRHI